MRTGLIERFKTDFQIEEARYAYAEDFLNTYVAAQIKNLREDRELSQERLAELVGTKQSGISRLENVNYSSWKVETLRKLARALGVRLRISFEEFGTLILEIETFDKNLAPRRFEDDPTFKEPAVKEPEPEEVYATTTENAGATPPATWGAAATTGRRNSLTQLALGQAGDDISWQGNSHEVANQIATRYQGMNQPIVRESRGVAQTLPEAISSKGAISATTADIQSRGLTRTHRGKVIPITRGRRGRTAWRYGRTSRSNLRGA